MQMELSLLDSDTSLVRYGARDYLPEIGRFTAKDPIRFGGSLGNLYEYALTDPINVVDKTGRGPTSGTAICGAIVAAVDAALAAKTMKEAADLGDDFKEQIEVFNAFCDAFGVSDVDRAAGLLVFQAELSRQMSEVAVGGVKTGTVLSIGILLGCIAGGLIPVP